MPLHKNYTYLAYTCKYNGDNEEGINLGVHEDWGRMGMVERRIEG